MRRLRRWQGYWVITLRVWLRVSCVTTGRTHSTQIRPCRVRRFPVFGCTNAFSTSRRLLYDYFRLLTFPKRLVGHGRARLTQMRACHATPFPVFGCTNVIFICPRKPSSPHEKVPSFSSWRIERRCAHHCSRPCRAYYCLVANATPPPCVYAQASMVINNDGHNYAVGDRLRAVGGTECIEAFPLSLQVNSVDANGGVTAATIIVPDSNGYFNLTNPLESHPFRRVRNRLRFPSQFYFRT